jgi:serine/threonine protein kinase
MLQSQKVSDPTALKEFEIEVMILSKINHPHIVQILGAGKEPRPFIILERLTDISMLLDLHPSRKPALFRRQVVTYAQLLIMAKGLADALSYLHSEIHPDAMIIHRDLKPENLGLSEDGKIKLYDFGLIRCVKKKSFETEVYEMTGHTGSIRYMAPEVVLNMPYSEKADVYSFAILIWTIARNKLPFRDLDRASHKTKVVIQGERPKLQNGWPEEFSNILEACWKHDMVKRPNFKDIASSLENMIRSDNSSKKFSMNASSKLSQFTRTNKMNATRRRSLGEP